MGVAGGAGGGDAPSVEDLLDRVRRWPLAMVLVVRLGVTAAPLPVLVQVHGLRPCLPVLLVAAEVLLVNAVVLVGLGRHAALDPRRVGRWLLADAGIAVALNLWWALAGPGTPADAHHDVFWPYLLGAVVLWTAWWGPWVGGALAAAGLPLRLAMGAVDGSRPDAGAALPVLVDRMTVLALAVLVAWALVLLLRLCARVALEEGVRAGRAAEQVRTLRSMHDTVLQTLEAIGLSARSGSGDPVRRLDRVASAARAQADELREMLHRDPAAAVDRDAAVVDARQQLVEALGPPLRDLAGSGVDVAVDSAALAGVALRGEVSDALRMGAREAARNVLRHAGASRATVRAVAYPDRVEVVVRDDGRGFDPAEAGFGIAQSMRARLREVDGDVEVRSRVRRGTTVRVWVPRA